MDSERVRLRSLRAKAREPSAAPWIIAGLATLLAFAVGRLVGIGSQPPPPPPPRPQLAAPEPAALPPPSAVEPNPAELGALRGCVERLDSLQTAVDRACPDLSRAPSAAATRAAAVGKAETRDGGASAAQDPVPADENERRLAFQRDFMARVVGVKGPAADWLAGYVCLVDDLRDRTAAEIESVIGDPNAFPDALDEAVAEAKQERDAMLGDVRARLGPERYKRLRDVGGLAILSDACPKRQHAVPSGADASVPLPE